MNYEVLQGNDDVYDEIGPKAITLYVENGQANQQKESIDAENDFMDTATVAGTEGVKSIQLDFSN
ncbi:hypothetical protein Bca52824_083293 [Brassica carinata]|uniref:Uncharacterized protein n=1 Tax=Brassica carinata TaxID=52824 RepID=A0A8X7TSY4_BRACI|nr:hypothetical protein Bca52824_083293 [Brassica carinata]